MTKNDFHLYDCHTHVGSDPFLASSVTPEAFKDLGGLLEDMERLGIDGSVVFPPVGTLYFNPFIFASGGGLQKLVYQHQTEDGEKKLRDSMACPYEFENRNLLVSLYDRHGEAFLFPFLAIHPSERVQKQLSVLESLADQYNIYGLKCHPTFMQADIRLLMTEGESLVEFAQHSNIPITIHSAVHPDDKWARPEYILEVAKTFPFVRIAIAHMARFDKNALQLAHALPNVYVDTAGFMTHVKLAQKKDHPGIAPQERRFSTDYRDPSQVLHDLVTSHPGTILFGTDNPAHYWIEEHQGTLFREINTLEEEVAPFRSLPESLQKEIGHDNTERFLFGE